MPKIGIRTYVTAILVTAGAASVFVPDAYLNAGNADKLWLAIASVTTFFFAAKSRES